ncbi:MAG: hypothetical protein JXR36_01200 [Bacteroidales bacterium]|nr:hypothetical protein [Bacteroidales bacterium]
MQKNNIGEFGPIYRQFKEKPREAIKHLKKVKKGEALMALYRNDIGYVDIVWGEHDDKTEKGFGLYHIIKAHAKEVKELGFEIEDFIILVFQFGQKKALSNSTKIYLEGQQFRVIITTEWKGKKKSLLLSTFDLRPVSIKNPKRLSKIKKSQK